MTAFSPSFDVVICVGVKDVFIVKKTVRFVNKNISPKHIYLIINKKFFCLFSQDFLNQEKVSLVDETKLVPDMNIQSVCSLVNKHFKHKMRAGWYFQQFLKMGFALSPHAGEYYLIWDADTIPTSPIRFFDSDGRMLVARKTEYHKPYFETMQRLIGMSKSVNFSFIAEHMIIKTEYMADLINNISRNRGGEKSGIKISFKPSIPNKDLAFLNLKHMELMSTIHIQTPLHIVRYTRSVGQASFLDVA